MDYTLNKDFPLTQEQTDVIDFLRRTPQGFNCTGTGGGKTYTMCTLAIHFMNAHPEYKCIVLCPNKANKAFSRELTNKLHEPFTLYEAAGFSVVGAKIPGACRFHIFNYSSMAKYYETIFNIRGDGKLFFLIDEAHNLQTPGTDRYKTAKLILGLGRIRWAMTATPLKNDLEGLYWMVDLIKPGYLSTYDWFRYRYQEYTKVKRKIHGQVRMVPEVSGYKNLEELKLLMSQIIIIKKIYFNLHFIYRDFPIEDVLLKAYRKSANGLTYEKETASGGTVKATRDWGARLHDLQRVLDNCHPSLEGVNFSNKEKDLCKVILEKTSNNESVLIYCDYYDTIDRVKFVLNQLLNKLHIYKIFEITGKQDSNERAQVEDMLRPRSVVVVSRAGSESINLQKANNVIFYDIPFAINDVIQMVGRVARMDSKYTDMYVYFLEYQATIDTYKRKLIQLHSSLIKNVICQDTNLPTEVLELDAAITKELKTKYVWKF